MERIFEREQLAWAAGLFDGEGYVGVNWQGPKGFPAIRIEASQKDRRVLDRFHSVVGGFGSIYIVGPRKGDPYFKWHCGKFEHVQAVIALLWTWLSPIKREQAAQTLREAKEAYASGRFPNRKSV